MDTKTMLPASLGALQQELEQEMPEYSFRIEKNILGNALVVRKGDFSGASIDLTQERLLVVFVVPSFWARVTAGALGVALVRLFVKDALEPKTRLLQYLSARYSPVRESWLA